MTHDQMIFLARVIEQATWTITTSMPDGCNFRAFSKIEEMIDAEIEREKATHEPVKAKTYWALKNNKNGQYLRISYDPDDVDVSQFVDHQKDAAKFVSQAYAEHMARNINLWKILTPVEIVDE